MKFIPENQKSRFPDIFHNLMQGFGSLKSLESVLSVIVLSLSCWIFAYLAIYFALNAYNIETNETEFIHKKNFTNKGFTLVYSEDLYKNKIISKKIDNRALIIFQKNLKKGTTVKIKNILNQKTVIAKVGNKSKYPLFNNSVISNRISKEIDLDPNEPYVEIFEILNNSSFIAKKAKTYDEEKNVAEKAPIDNITINNLNDTVTKIAFNTELPEKQNHRLNTTRFSLQLQNKFIYLIFRRGIKGIYGTKKGFILENPQGFYYLQF